VTRGAEGSPKARIVTALLRDADRILLCHRSPRRRWYPDVWDLPGGHVEPGEMPGAALARELREELGIAIAIAWFTEDALGELSLAHDSYPAIFSQVLAEHQA
jgi:8-oxo-dGTP diphosphatase